MKPAFLPLKKKWFDLFKSGEKTVEYRRYGGRWVEKNFEVGREVVISCGYSGERIPGVVKSVRRNPKASTAFIECYGEDVPMLEIEMVLNGV